MAIAALEIPLINPLRFIPQEGELPKDARDNIIHFDADWFINYIRAWQQEATYAQPWQFNDKIAFQFHANSELAPSLNLIDCKGKVWHTFSPFWSDTVSGVSVKEGSLVIPATTHHFKFRFSDVSGLPEGIYVLHLEQPYDLDEDTVADYTRNNLSEPISIATEHFGTARLDYYHSYNDTDKDILFTQSGARFSLRLKADIQEFTFPIHATNYEDGGNNARLLGATVYRKTKFVTTERVPEWVNEKLSYAWSCDNVSFEGVRYTIEPGADWEISRLSRYPKVALALPVRPADKKYPTRQIVATTVELYATGTYPYLVYQLTLNDAVGSENLLPSGPVVINDLTAENAFVSDLNTLAAAEDWAGTFSIASGNLIYTNVGADLFLSSFAEVYSNPFTYTVASGSVAQAIHFENAVAIIAWGDGNLETVNGGGAVSSAVHNYSIPGTHNIQVYGFYTAVTFDDGYMTTVAGKLPAGLEYFTLKNSFTIASFDAAVFSLCTATLAEIRVFSCSSLATVTNLSAQNLVSIFFVSFANNALTTIQASGVVVSIDSIVGTNGGPLYGYLYVNNQSPAAPLNISGTTSAANLIGNYGWQVYND